MNLEDFLLHFVEKKKKERKSGHLYLYRGKIEKQF